MEDKGDFSQSPRCNEACEFVLAHGSIVHHFGFELQKPLPFPSL